LLAEDRPPQDPRREGHDDGHDDDLDRDAEQAAKADELKLRRREDHLVGIGEGLGDAAPGDEEDERGDDRLDLVAGD